MSKLIKYLKPFTLSIIAIIGLLLVQVTCDLALPDYTSNIVNIGIQQGGVENAVPTVIRKDKLDQLLVFVTTEEKDKVREKYRILQDNSAYTNIGEQVLYVLNTKDKNEIDRLNNILAKPMLIAMEMEKEAPSQIANLSKVPKEQLKSILDKANKQIEALPKSMITQGAVAYVQKEYESIGINKEHLQNSYIFHTGAIMVGIALLSMACAVCVVYLGAKVGTGFSKKVRHEVFKKVVGFSNTEFDTFSTASLITRSTNDIQQIQVMLLMTFRIIFYAPLLGMGGIIKVLGTDTSMGWITAIAIGAIFIVILVLFKIVVPKFKSVQGLIDRLNQVTREFLTGMLVIRAFNTEKYEEKRFEEANNNLTKTNLFINRTMALMMPLMTLIMNGVTILIVWVSAHQINDGAMQVGDMMAFIQYTMQIIMSFLMISMVSIMLPRALVSAQRVSEVLETDAIIKDKKITKEFDSNKKGYVTFKNVSFKYPGAEDCVLSNIDFTAVPGQTTAFIGSTGSGKSTLVNLIPRFYDITEGEILVDGVDIRDVGQKTLRDKIGYVPQKGILFSGTIESNLAYGQKEYDEASVLKAAKIAQAMEFIDTKEDKFKSKIAEGGGNVSGGQKQRLSIARAIAKNPEIYIFDDSFSALDFKTDAALRKALGEGVKDSTMLIVAQRISTIMQAEQIIVLDEGKIVGKGTHKELLKNCEVYKQIALSQLSEKELMA